eukprot:898088-Rhodomonas_salina.2
MSGTDTRSAATRRAPRDASYNLVLEGIKSEREVRFTPRTSANNFTPRNNIASCWTNPEGSITRTVPVPCIRSTMILTLSFGCCQDAIQSSRSSSSSRSSFLSCSSSNFVPWEKEAKMPKGPWISGQLSHPVCHDKNLLALCDASYVA